ncbi:hypothetical protein MPH_13365 [Macrophomina phaseolina MS6]|uniref:Uncharacterized protein n=1 Tax=Macrophomina phaseolina (strain MS6) TaxID=1126212 RepID=K2R606_MACPH|nr:hypothetical protein MPH_13365 [Macrophomina phaseolina MS6]
MPDNFLNEADLCDFSSAVVEEHRLAFQKIPIEALVSFALNSSSTGIIPFLESHNDPATLVEESKTDIVKMWARDRASREDHRFELLKQALQIGQEGKPDVSNPTENFLYTKTLSSIRENVKVGSKDAYIARIYHNVTLHGWSTVFTCVICGDLDLKATKPGLEGFKKVCELASLMMQEEKDGKEGRMKIFF